MLFITHPVSNSNFPKIDLNRGFDRYLSILKTYLDVSFDFYGFKLIFYHYENRIYNGQQVFDKTVNLLKEYPKLINLFSLLLPKGYYVSKSGETYLITFLAVYQHEKDRLNPNFEASHTGIKSESFAAKSCLDGDEKLLNSSFESDAQFSGWLNDTQVQTKVVDENFQERCYLDSKGKKWKEL